MPITKPRPLTERFWPKVSKQPSGCWVWTGYLNQSGYGEVQRGRRGEGTTRTHRLSWELHKGEVPDGLFVLHRCDNRRCCNPDHLFLGTHQDNMDDMHAKKRAFTPFKKFKGEAHPMHKLTNETVKTIREKSAAGIPARQLAVEFHVTPESIYLIRSRQTWRHI